MLDWRVGDERIAISEPEEPTPRGRWPWRRWLARGFALLVVIGVVALAYTWRTAQVRQTRLQVDAQAAVDSELSALLSGQDVVAWDAAADRLWQTRYANFARTWVRTARPTGATATVQEVELVAPDLVLAHVETKLRGAEGERTLRSTRAYRINGTRWERTSIDDLSWGPWQLTETDHFRLVYRERDGELASAVADGLDAFYTAVRGHLGGPPPGQARLAVTIDSSAPWTDVVRTEDGYRIGSPLVSFAGVDSRDTPADLVRWSLASAIVSQAARDGNLEVSGPWRNLLSAMLQAEARLFAHPPAGARDATSGVLRSALNEGRLVPLARLENASGDLVLAAAEWDAFGEFLVTRHGAPAPSRVIVAARTAPTWQALVADALHVAAADLDTTFTTWLHTTRGTR